MTGHGYLLLPAGQGWTAARDGAISLAWQGVLGHLATFSDSAEASFVTSSFQGQFDWAWIGLWQDPTDPSYSEPSGGWSWSTGEALTFSNWDPGQPNEVQPAQNYGEMSASGTWNDAHESFLQTNYLLVEFDASEGPGLFCWPPPVNSTGQSVTLGFSTFAGPTGFHIEALGGPMDHFAMVVVSASTTPAPLAVSQGLLCLASPIGRYNSVGLPSLGSIGRFDSSGVMLNLLNTSTTGTGFDIPTQLPSPPGGVIAPGSTWHFQVWYTDQGGSSSFSNGLSVTF